MEDYKPRKPRKLYGTGAKLWEQITERHGLGVHEAALVEELCRIRSHITDLDAEVERDGVTVPAQGGSVKAHPCLTEARQQRLAFARIVQVLEFPDVEAP